MNNMRASLVLAQNLEIFVSLRRVGIWVLSFNLIHGIKTLEG